MAKRYWYRALFKRKGKTVEETGTYELSGESPVTIIEDIMETSAGTIESILVWEMTPEGDLSPYTVASLRPGLDAKPSEHKPREIAHAPVNLNNATPAKEPVIATPRLSTLLEKASWAHKAKISSAFRGEFAVIRKS